jgi:hypothetical protein
MFTTSFWIDMVIGDAQGNANADENQDAGPAGARQGGINDPGRIVNEEEINVQDEGVHIPERATWQGKDGAIAQTVESMKAFVLDWEWDKVDKQSLLQNCAYPVAKHLAISCVVPTAASLLILPLIDAMGKQVGPTSTFRIFAIVSIIVDFVNSSKSSLQRWFQVAHKIARDDRYLIGLRLQNYSPQQTPT